MSTEQDTDGLNSPAPQQHDEPVNETLTDLVDRMDREAFRRLLEQRDLRVLSTRVGTQR